MTLASPITFTTVDGRKYENAEIVDSNPYEITVSYEGLTGKVHLEDLPSDLQIKFGFNREKAIEWKKEQRAKLIQSDLEAISRGFLQRLSSDHFPPELSSIILRYNEEADLAYNLDDAHKDKDPLLSYAVAMRSKLFTAIKSYLSFITDLERTNPQEAETARSRVAKHEFYVGMPSQLFTVSYGLPSLVRSQKSSGATQEQWYYVDRGKRQEFFFQNDQLVSWDD